MGCFGLAVRLNLRKLPFEIRCFEIKRIQVLEVVYFYCVFGNFMSSYVSSKCRTHVATCIAHNNNNIRRARAVRRRSDSSPRRLLFRGHSARCTVNTVACLAEFTLTVDYALSACGSLAPAAVGLLAQLSSGLVCHMLEAAGQPGPMCCGVLAWLVCGLSRALLFVSLVDAGFAAHAHVRPPAVAMSAVCCYAAATLHLYAVTGVAEGGGGGGDGGVGRLRRRRRVSAVSGPGGNLFIKRERTFVSKKKTVPTI